MLRGAKWGAKLQTHRRTVTDTSGTQPLKSRGIWTFTNTNGRFRDALQAGGQGFDSPQLHQGGFVEFGDFSSRNRPGFCRSRSEGLNPSRWLPGEGPSRFVVVAKRTVLGWCFHSECFGPYVLCSWLGCWRQVALVPMVNKDLRDLQAPTVSKAQLAPMVSKDLRDLQAPTVSKDLRDLQAPTVSKDLRDLQAPTVSKDLRVRRGLRDRVARRMVRHARMRPVLLGP